MNLPTHLWGPQLWQAAHAITFAFPTENPSSQQQAAAQQFFQAWRALIPCESCRTHWATLLDQLPPDATSRDSLSRWLVEAHNRVNARIGKPQLAYDDVAAKFDTAHQCDPLGECNDPRGSPSIEPGLLLGLVVLLSVIAVAMFLRK